ncbi:MAG: C40 family peptidase [Burkholderiaceae bacterium]|nr:C40 family peptidase [Burkholderiaceae bacterium]
MKVRAAPFRCLVAAGLLAACVFAQAEPDAAAPANPPSAAAAATDPIMGLLGERGLLRPLATSAMVDSMRNSVRDAASDLVMTAMNFLGVPYVRGGDSAESGFDCSGFTRHIFENSIGLVLPRRADEQARSAGLLAINRAELRPGDLVFFNTMKRSFSHVGIYVGDDKFIHAPRTGSRVRIEDMRDAYWARRFTGARRADLTAALPQVPVTR